MEALVFADRQLELVTREKLRVSLTTSPPEVSDKWASFWVSQAEEEMSVLVENLRTENTRLTEELGEVAVREQEHKKLNETLEAEVQVWRQGQSRRSLKLELLLFPIAAPEVVPVELAPCGRAVRAQVSHLCLGPSSGAAAKIELPPQGQPSGGPRKSRGSRKEAQDGRIKRKPASFVKSLCFHRTNIFYLCS